MNQCIIGALMVAAGATSSIANASPCIRITDTIPPAFAAAWQVPAERLAKLRQAHSRLERAAHVHALLLVCGDPAINAEAVPGPVNEVRVNVGLLLEVDDEDQLAAVLGHEFAHMALDHFRKGAKNEQEALQRAQAAWRTDIVATGDTRIATRDALLAYYLTAAPYEQTLEREADDAGLKFAVRAGYAPSGAYQFHMRMLKLGGPARAQWFDSHPGFGERAWYSGHMALSENYKQKALEALNHGDGEALAKVAREWRSHDESSGGAAYYGAAAALMLKRPATDVTELIEDATNNFTVDRYSIMGEEYSNEIADAAVALCAALYREGSIYPALNCAKRLHPSDVERLRAMTGWKDFLVLGPSRENASRSVFGARNRQDRSIILSTCERFSTRLGLRRVAPWNSFRRAAQPIDDSHLLMCDTTLCGCKVIGAY